MKRVSYRIAKAIKKAGYPQEDCDGYLNKYGAVDAYLGYNIARPTYLDVWLWLWGEKRIEIEVLNDGIGGLLAQIRIQSRPSFFKKDPEEAIIAAIEYLADNNLIE